MLNKLVIKSLCSISLLCFCAVAGAETTLIRFARLVDGTGELLKGREVLVTDGVITKIGDHLELQHPHATRVILDELTGLPGLIDVHVHMTYALAEESGGDAWAQLFTTSAPDRLVGAIKKSRQTLQSGVTSARDLFAFDGVDFHLKKLIDSGIVPGPKLFLSGLALHPMTVNETAEDDPLAIVEEFSKQVQQRIASGADWIKIFATGGSADDLGDEQQYHYPELKAATDAAHAAGLKVAVHSYGPSAVADALNAGVDSIEHPIGLTKELITLWQTTDTVYVPTIDHNRYYAEHRSEYGYNDNVERNLEQFIQANIKSLARVHKAGIPIAMGSDAVMSMFGQNARELEWFVTAGMTHAETIQAATINGAALLGQSAILGRLHPGFAADIVAVNGNPLKDIQALTRRVEWVMKDGEIVIDLQSINRK